MKKLLAPLMAIAVVVVLLVTAGLGLQANNAPNESLAYFIKTVHPDRVLVVEPNLSAFVKAGAIASDAGEALKDSLAEIAQQYEVSATRLIHVERNIGSIVPNLLVYVQPAKLAQVVEAELATSNN